MTRKEFLAILDLGKASKFNGLRVNDCPSREIDASLTDQVDYLVHNCGDNSKKVVNLLKMKAAIESGLTDAEKEEVGRYIQELLNHWIPIVNVEKGHTPIPLPEPIPRQKLKWLRKPSEFGHLFSMLAQSGFLQLPSGEGMNYNEFARVCMELFDFDGATTFQNLAKELNPSKNSLPSEKQDEFQIPDCSELKPKPLKKVPKR